MSDEILSVTPGWGYLEVAIRTSNIVSVTEHLLLKGQVVYVNVLCRYIDISE